VFDFIADNPRLVFPFAFLLSGLFAAILFVIACRSRKHPVRGLVGAAIGLAFLVAAWRLEGTYWINRYNYEFQDRAGINVSSYSIWTVRDGAQHRLDEYGGKPVLLYLWGTYCGPCRPSLPVLARLAVALQGRAAVILLSTEDRETLLAYSEHQQIPAIAAYAPEPLVPPGSSWAFPQAPRPTLFFIDEKGVVQRIMVGPRAGAYLRKLVEDPRGL
jgi:thiol-disulfide isomerase/thioredoxin